MAQLLAASDIGAPGILLVVGLVSLLEDSVGLGAILPAETVVVAAGAAAAHGLVEWWGVFLVAWIFGAAGDMIGFGIGRRWGRTLIERYGDKVGLTPKRVEEADDFVDRWGVLAVAGGRLVPAVRVLLMPTAGASTMRWQSFVLADLAGAGLWAAIHTMVGYLVGVGLKHANDAVLFGGLIVVAVVGAGTVWWMRRRRSSSGNGEAPA
jgi:undecaprenyl-diphosphatase